MKLRLAPIAAMLMVFFAGGPALAAIATWRAEVVRAYPHDPAAFTEGLFYRHGYLYESTGLAGRSSVRKVDLETGKVLQSRAVPARYFGEGIVAWRGRLIQLTWLSHLGFIYDLATFRPLGTFAYRGQGWALTRNGRHLIMSDGTPRLRFLDPTTLRQVRSITVTADGAPVRNLNELEWVKGQIFANIWMTDTIARIDPANGRVLGWIDLGGLMPRSQVGDDRDAVANGIAYDARGDRLFVTGKLWPKLFQIKLVRTGAPRGRRHG